jgi:signal peptidase II
MLIALLVALFIICADQATKMLIVSSMSPGQDKPVIDGILHLHLTRNSGAAFSFLPGKQWLFIIASTLAAVGIIVYLATKKKPVHWFGLLSLGLIMGGALGNLFDRLRTADHTVIDFIYVKIINFAVFNVADSSITVGAILLCIYILFFHEKFTKKLGVGGPDLSAKPDEAIIRGDAPETPADGEPDSGEAQG